MGKENVAYIYNGILFSHKKGDPAFATSWMDLEGITAREISHRKRNTL